MANKYYTKFIRINREKANETDKIRKRLKYQTDSAYREIIKERNKLNYWKRKMKKLDNKLKEMTNEQITNKN